MQPSEIDVADMAAYRRESELDFAEHEWTKIPPAPQPGYFPIEPGLAAKCGLEPGTPVSVDEFVQLMLFAKGLPASYRSRKKDVRPFVWQIVVETKKPDGKM